MHKMKFAHRDLKPQNVLLFGTKSVAKISDFGTSKMIQTIQTNHSTVGTPKYTAPELLEKGLRYGAPADIYSFAIILYELFSGLEAFPNWKPNTPKDLKWQPTFTEKFPRELKILVSLGLNRKSKERPQLSH